MARGLRAFEQRAGLSGLALLRLRHAADASPADEVVAELRATLASADAPEAQRVRRYPVLEPAAGYARWAAFYDLPSNPLVAHEEPAVRDLVGGGARVLDAGCGTGRHLAWLLAEGRHAVGVDQSQEMLAVARHKLPGADLRAGRLEALPIADATFDGVVCALALEHVDDLDVCFRELARVVRPGGWVVVSMLHPTMVEIPGWTAWFIDGDGRSDVRCFAHRTSDYLNAASANGLRLGRCTEVALDPALAGPLGPGETAISTRLALEGLPLVLALRFDVP